MDKKIFSFLFSTRLMAVLFIVFAAAMAAGTFIEDAYNTDTARIIVYNSWWFEAIMFFFMLNFLGNIKRYQLYKKEKWATLVLHLSFILILAGAFITRYISYEGMMPIREGATENQVYSDRTFLTMYVDGMHNGEMKRKTIEKPLLLSAAVDNDFDYKDNFSDVPFEVELIDFVMGAKEIIKPDEKGILFLKMVEAGGGERHEHYLKEGEVQSIHNILFALNKYTKGAVNITINDKESSIETPFDGNFMRMADQMKGNVMKDTKSDLMYRSLYNVGGSQFVFPEAAIKGVKEYKSNGNYKDKETDDALVFKVSNQGKEKTITLLGSKGKVSEPQAFKLGDLEYTVIFGSKVYDLPFKVRLNKFIASKYPGTEKSYSAFESQVTILDEKPFDARIFMNNILDHKGYRFFQAGFDPDEKGTKLSVNYDFWGTWITYIGYFLLYIAMLAILFTKHSRFGDLKAKLKKVRLKKESLLVVVLFLSFAGFAQHGNHKHQKVTEKQIDELLHKFLVPKEHAEKFGRLVIQDAGGRMKPINTFSSELLRKVSKSDTYKDMNADQVFLSITQFPQIWYEVPVIYLKKGNDSIRKIIGIDKEAKYAKMIDFFDAKGNYKLTNQLDKAYKAAVPNAFETDFIEADRKVNLLYSALSGQILKIFPKPHDSNNKWVSYLELNEETGTALDTVKNVLPFYLNSLDKAATSKDYKLANSLVLGLDKYQKKYGYEVRPTDRQIDLEILYNKFDVFKKLYSWYIYVGLLMFMFVIINIFNKKKWVKISVNIFHGIVAFLFLLHTAGLISRWYISGHAPWSNAYESMIYVGWSIMFFGLVFGRKSALTVASTSFVAAMILMVAHWSWMDPEIANLQPVLNSYWLMIHVAVIVGSYGPFALGAILGLVALGLMLFTNEKNKKVMDLSIKEITYINEMSLTVGLVMLTIGNFLGGQWANESWGRYWGWDPKETWALISIMVYAFVIHMRFVPALRGKFIYNFMSVLAFASVLMTYFGVNFHLSGLHSYASGERQNVVIYLYVLIGFLAYSGLVYFRYRKFKK
ncbi:cytochrome c biogenesis protein CcsA [Flavobacterium amniphilum]|uniref:cytochrome c biogenesis protein CcsA n=1 Tax=Flavobacterium amniphilum TaxID=1834035 RepID=UPI002029BC39|nr:cytochrome c biogenesis protein CcsA [Flavobacterium amniphilum]MCL9805733.1 cytochrome c biogenesis protein CcsA [Flavobacterium amniphilum]MCL9806320.1 cytochrome c biogenesis protein CcsA [Flavobacterium amniphilum]